MIKKIVTNKYVFIPAAVFLLFFIFYLLWNLNYKERVYPSVFLGETKISGKNYQELKTLILQEISEIETNGINFVSEYNKKVTKEKNDSLDTGSTYNFLTFYPEESALLAFDSSGNKNFFKFIGHILNPNKRAYLKVEIEKTGLDYFLKNSFPELIIPAENAYFSLNNSDLVINKEKVGKNINFEDVFSQLEKSLQNLNNKDIFITTLSHYPDFFEKDLFEVKAEAEIILKTGESLELIYLDNLNKERSWRVEAKDIVSWLELKGDSNNKLISLNESQIKSYLEENLVPEINKDIVLPKFEMIEEKVSNWQVGKDGQELDLLLSAQKINNSFILQENKIELEIKKISVDEFVSENNFKIKEIIGTGHSNFKGSSVNRRHNIKIGADTLHGLLIKPDEEFSLIAALGDIDGENGYRTELVIKDGRTIPEYGGGLCQVGTTMFRTTLKSGLPITMRRNHSYRVSYYEPAGTDATIYDPWPDFRFINDTGNYILIQSRINGDDMYFDFWGLQDGRKVELTDPVIYNIVKPPDTKYIETDELAPGEEKCTEKSHNGASAYFDYKVTYPEGSTTTPVVERRFSSYYVPWQAVCLVGKQLETKTTDETIVETKTNSTETTNNAVEMETE